MIEQAELADVTDEAFGRQLHVEYLELARAEKVEYDNSDADAFAGRALAGAAGTPTAPIAGRSSTSTRDPTSAVDIADIGGGSPTPKAKRVADHHHATDGHRRASEFRAEIAECRQWHADHVE